MSEIDVRSTGIVVPAQRSYFDDLIENAAVRDSGVLVLTGQEAFLIGCPLVVKGVTIRPSEIKNAVTGKHGTYVSLELVIGNERAMTSVRFTPAPDFPWEPEESIILNDGSTGLKRQVLSYLQANNAIDVRNGSEKAVVAGGKIGISYFDRLPTEWNGIDVENIPGVECNITSDTEFSVYIPLDGNGSDGSGIRPIFARRGLRVSEYANEYTQSGETYYFA